MGERQKTFRATIKTFSVRSVNVNVYKVLYEIFVGIKMLERHKQNVIDIMCERSMCGLTQELRDEKVKCMARSSGGTLWTV